MTISTYQELKDSVGNWSARGDLGTSGANASRVDEIIDNAEAMINNDLRTLDMETKIAFPISGEYSPAPSNFGGVRSFTLNTNPRVALTFMADDSQAIEYSTSSGPPRFFSVTNGQFRFAPVPDGSYTATLVYFLKVPSLSSTQTTNWLLTSHPHIYLAACQMWTYTFLQDQNAASTFAALYKSLMQDLKAADRSMRWGGNGMAVRLG